MGRAACIAACSAHAACAAVVWRRDAAACYLKGGFDPAGASWAAQGDHDFCYADARWCPAHDSRTVRAAPGRAVRC
jgi:hypothetical protein